jgi:endonuclease/exonuclease/phosphatase family metal-dependent hydrolase
MLMVSSLFSERSIRSDIILMQGGARACAGTNYQRDVVVENDVTTKIASHNIMDGLKLKDLYKYYSTGSFDVLCLQEDVHNPPDKDSRTYSQRIADAMTIPSKKNFTAHYDLSAPRLATIYNTSKYKLRESAVMNLKRLASRSIPDRFMFGGGPTERKFALISVLSSRQKEKDKKDLVVVNFHLDAQGDNLHRYNQIRDLLIRVKKRYDDLDVVMCGDTNMFDVNRGKQVKALAMMLQTFERFGLHPSKDCNAEATHFFARADEPKFAHQIAVAFGRLGVDFPECFDIIASNANIVQHGQVRTVESDHDLIWVAVQH